MSTRRGAGLSALQSRSSYASHGAALRSSNLSSYQTQLSVFQSLLHTFALQHGDKIKENPAFRAEFARMCNAIGVDPLAGSNVTGKGKKSGKGSWWSQIMGGDVGDFYFGLAVKVVEVCRDSRGENGGLIGVEECRERIRKGREIGGGIEVTDDDISRAVKSLGPLGSGFSIIAVGKKQMIRSIPKELNTDQATVLGVIQALRFVTVSMLEDNLKWEYARAETVIKDLLADSLLWVDAKAPEKEYWSPASMYADDE